jgi:hypothetical protein
MKSLERKVAPKIKVIPEALTQIGNRFSMSKLRTLFANMGFETISRSFIQQIAFEYTEANGEKYYTVKNPLMIKEIVNVCNRQYAIINHLKKKELNDENKKRVEIARHLMNKKVAEIVKKYS